ncbi:MAG: arsenate reductase ArsC [Anaerolineales bacterium]
MAKRPRVLFLCTHNSARSQMAEAFLRKYGDEHFEAHSAGLEPAEIHPLTRRVMEEAGIDLQAEGYRSKGLIEEYLDKQVHVGYLITVCSNAEEKCPIYPGVGVREYWGFEDPAAFEGSEEERLARFRETRDLIEARVKAFVEAEMGPARS